MGPAATAATAATNQQIVLASHGRAGRSQRTSEPGEAAVSPLCELPYPDAMLGRPFRSLLITVSLVVLGGCGAESRDGTSTDDSCASGTVANDDGECVPEAGDPCEPDPCQNGGTCLAQDDSYLCSCQAGYQGDHCETDIDECEPDPCQNGGTCVDGIADYACHCPPKFIGDHCQDPADPGLFQFETEVQPLLVTYCGSCHLGHRFGIASLERAGDAFTEEETLSNYQTFLDMIALDAPTHSRLLTKVLPVDLPRQTEHAGGPLLSETDAEYETLLAWIELEKAQRCPDCGLSAPTQYLAYVDTPNIYWALERSPTRSDHGLRQGEAKIMLQPIDPVSYQPQGDPIDFLDGQLCNASGECDFGHLAINHAGDQMAFECRLPVELNDDWVADATWNVCIAEIGTDGKAVNARMLRPESERHRASFIARSSPFGLYDNGAPLKGIYDHHFNYRKSDDKTPAFSPDDQRIYLSSRGPDPRTGLHAARTYHGFEFIDNVLALKLDGSDARTIYLNDGGTADHPMFMRDGQLAVHVWNLERIDNHSYIRITPDGMMEQPVLFGRIQGVNMWGKLVEVANGSLIGETGRRRGAVELFQPFVADHTLGTGIDPTVTPYQLLDPAIDTLEAHFAYCHEPPAGQNCTVDRFYIDPAYSPDGRVFIAHNPELTYVSQGEQMYAKYSSGSTLAERLASMQPYVPQKMGIWLLDHKGQREVFVAPPQGRLFRYPAWVGKRQPPRSLPWKTDESVDWAQLHIAHLPTWLSFRDQTGTDKTSRFETLNTITSLRVLYKVIDNNDCMDDGRPYRNSVLSKYYDHPTHLGGNNATGYVRLSVSAQDGGDAWGDVALQADGSVRVRVPAGVPLLFQGVDADGHVVRQHARVFAMPPGHVVDTGVTAAQYPAKCAPCHGASGGQEYVGLSELDQLAAEPMDFATAAAQAPVVDLTAASVTQQTLTYLHQLRPLFDTHCISCHSGESPAGELSLQADYSATGNYPAGSWVQDTVTGLVDLVPDAARVPSYNFSAPYSWLFNNDNVAYKEHAAYAPLIAAHAPTADLAPWDPGYQNLRLNQSAGRFYYLGGDGYQSHYGRADRLGGNSKDAWLIEILTGKDIEPDRDFTGPDHTGYFTEAEIRLLQAIMDVGFPYMSRCDDKTIPSGPHAGQPWGDPQASLP